ncbi:hypothetical protein HMPREF1551_00427 [Capnocytophaga sp. oral taxon 863 str. F0517]|nr:hypothetical protein HMPREF1551_00427 [Capnocytophaga sp. oral taxon 863 str. F0517]
MVKPLLCPKRHYISIKRLRWLSFNFSQRYFFSLKPQNKK